MGLIHVPKHVLGLSRPVGFIHNWKHAKKKSLLTFFQVRRRVSVFFSSRSWTEARYGGRSKSRWYYWYYHYLWKYLWKYLWLSHTITYYHHYLSLSITIYQTCLPLTVSRKTQQPVGDPSLMTFSILLLSFKIMSLLDRSSWWTIGFSGCPVSQDYELEGNWNCEMALSEIGYP